MFSPGYQCYFCYVSLWLSVLFWLCVALVISFKLAMFILGYQCCFAMFSSDTLCYFILVMFSPGYQCPFGYVKYISVIFCCLGLTNSVILVMFSSVYQFFSFVFFFLGYV